MDLAKNFLQNGQQYGMMVSKFVESEGVDKTMARAGRGVNLGNWLVLERWMKPSLFEGVEGKSETAFCLQKENAAALLKEHRDTYITLSDFQWMKEHGIQTVRIPIPHWVFGDFAPNIGCLEYLDRAMDWANQTKLQVLLDMHGAAGSQNGEMHSGLEGVMEFEQEENICRTIDVIAKLTRRYKDEPSLWGIQMLNEPAAELSHQRLREYYERCYREIRRIVDSDKAVVFHDQFNMYQWKDFMQSPEFQNVVMDTHIYHCFNERCKYLNPHELIAMHFEGWPRAFKELGEHFKLIAGEWSLSVSSTDPSIRNATPAQLDAFYRAFAAVQMLGYESIDGYFFWSYRCDEPQWSYRTATQRHYMPSGPTEY